MRSFPVHTAAAIVSLGVLITAANQLWPSVRGPQSAWAALSSTKVPALPWNRHIEPGLPLPKPVVVGEKIEQPALLDDSGGTLDYFYRALLRTEKGQDGAVTRILHYGDSPTTADLITGDVRAMLQQRFFDAGHGFVLIAKPWAWYQHTGVEISAAGWQMWPASRFESHDGLFGLGGVSFTGKAQARSRITWKDARHTAFEVWYLAQAGGGAFTISADGIEPLRVETAAATKKAAFADYKVDSGSSEVDLRVESGTVRLFGIVASKAGPGLVYDSIGLNGASITVITRMFNQEHWTEELRHRDPQLLVINYGSNEADFAAFVEKGYEKELREAIHRARAALPEASILVMSPMDRGSKTGDGEIATMPTIPRIVEIQRRVARETGCGFFDTYDAMGGEGTMARWYAARPRLVSADFLHPYPAGGKIVASIFVKELLAGLDRYKLRSARKLSTQVVR